MRTLVLSSLALALALLVSGCTPEVKNPPPVGTPAANTPNPPATTPAPKTDVADDAAKPDDMPKEEDGAIEPAASEDKTEAGDAEEPKEEEGTETKDEDESK